MKKFYIKLRTVESNSFPFTLYGSTYKIIANEGLIDENKTGLNKKLIISIVIIFLTRSILCRMFWYKSEISAYIVGFLMLMKLNCWNHVNRE